MADKNVYAKLLAVQEDLKAPKNKYNNFGKYNYRNLESIFEGLKPCLKKHNATIFVTDEIVTIEGRFYVKATATFVDLDTKETVSGYGYAREAEHKTGMDESQITGASSSYARKYSLNGLLLIDDTADADTEELATEIENRTKGTKNTPSKEDMQKTEKVLIDEAKQKVLEQRCKDKGVSVVTLLDKCHLKSLADVSEKQFYWLSNDKNWEKLMNGE